MEVDVIGDTADQVQATTAPITAKDIIPAAGIVAADGPKCFWANTYASVGLLLNVSITSALLDDSFMNMNSLLLKYCDISSARKHPNTGSKQDPTMLTLFMHNEDAEFAALPATSNIVDKTPTNGQNGPKRLTKRGANSPVIQPASRGSNTRRATDCNTERKFTSTTVCKKYRISKGVASTPMKVVEMVWTTDRAISPPAKCVKRFEA